MKLYRNNRNGTFTDVTKRAGLDVEMYGMGVAVGDYNNDGFPDIFVTCVGQSRLFQNTGKGTFVDVTKPSGLVGEQGLSTSALWFDYDRDGCWTCSSAITSNGRRSTMYSAVWMETTNPTALRKLIAATLAGCYRNRGNGTFEDVTAKSGIFDSSCEIVWAWPCWITIRMAGST